MTTQKMNYVLVAVLLMLSFACGIPAPAPQADPNAFNTMVAQTAQVQLLPPAQPLQPTQPAVSPPTAIPPTQGPSVLVNTTINLPRHTALDLETQAISNPLANMELIGKNLPDLSGYYKKAPAGSDVVFYVENPTAPDWEFLYPINGTRIAFPQPTLSQASYDGCLQAFKGEAMVVPGKENEAFPLDYYVFITAPGIYYCFTTDRGNLGTFKLTAPGNYLGMPYVIIDYILWDTRLP
ncbi:MAG: hypothetical protein MUO77_00700 [Anaerolineales bacterium]|nr:hypothetical protein [Anaerolineales bacterium]